MSRIGCAALAAALIFSGQAAVAADMVYKHRPANLPALKAYDGQPFWIMLAECAGMYGALANRYKTEGQSAAVPTAAREGVSFLKAATGRLEADRGLSQPQAVRLATERVELGRTTAMALFAERTAPDLSHEQILELFCRSVNDTHLYAGRFRRR